jgi:hypothetical protein
MYVMRKRLPSLLIAAVPLLLAGCASNKQADEMPPVQAPINNNAPEAKNAPPAPVDPRSLIATKMKKSKGH